MPGGPGPEDKMTAQSRMSSFIGSEMASPVLAIHVLSSCA